MFDYAQLIVRDETEARNKRFVAVAVAPLWEKKMSVFVNTGRAVVFGMAWRSIKNARSSKMLTRRKKLPTRSWQL